MKLRCELHLGQDVLRLLLVPKAEEKLDHLALKLAAFVMFWKREPVVEPSSDHPALAGFDIKPDVMALNIYGQIDLWIECGSVTLHKLDKITRRFPQTRIVVLKGTHRESERLRNDLNDEVRHAKRIEIWHWPEDRFKEWLRAMGEKTEIFGEATEKMMNLVVNEVAYAVDFLEL